MADIISFIGTTGQWNSFSVGEKANYTDTGGANYTTIAAFESDFGNHADGDLVGTGDVVIGEIKGTHDEQNVFNSWVDTDATNHITIRAEKLNAIGKYDHVADTGSVWGGSSYVCDNYEYLFVEDIHFGDPANNYTIYARSGATTIVNRCTFEFDTASGCDSSGSTQEFNSCLIIQAGAGSGSGMIRYQALDHCTYICDDTLGAIVRDGTCSNVLIYNADATLSYDNFESVDGGSHNAQSTNDQGAPYGSNSVDDVPSTDFNNYASADYTLSGTGADVYHAGTTSVTLDHDNVAFDVTTPSIGAFEYVAAGGGATPKGPLGHVFYGPFRGPIS